MTAIAVTGPGPGNQVSWSEEMEKQNPFDQEARGGGGRSRNSGELYHGGKSGSRTWAERLSSTLPTCWNKNILEVILEKDSRGSFIVNESDCARMMRKIGLDIRPGVQVEGVQICPSGRGLILITLKKEVKIESFCGHDVFEVTDNGIRAVNIKPAGKREVVVHIKNIHPNTMDEGVINYLDRFGKVVNKKVIHGVFKEGPLSGFRNGDRSYKMEIKPNTNIGTYHVIDGQRVTIRYPGQLQTCARCHNTARTCLGKGIARKCEELGGEKVDFSDHIAKLWNDIGYSPEKVEINVDVDKIHEEEESLVQQEGGIFTPKKVAETDTDKFAGVSIKTFPKEVEHSQIAELLLTSGLPAQNMNEIVIHSHGAVTIKNIENTVCKTLIQKLHMQTFFGKKVFCNGIIPLTPDKPVQPQHATPSSGTTSTPPAQGSTPSLVTTCDLKSVSSVAITSTPSPVYPPHYVESDLSRASVVTPAVSDNHLAVAGSSPHSSHQLLSTVTQISSSGLDTDSTDTTISAFSPADTSLLDIGGCKDIHQFLLQNKESLNNEDLARRFSISLRSPPSGSLAAEIIQSSTSTTPMFGRAESLISELKEMTSKLSDFESCISSSSDNNEEPVETNNVEFRSMNERKRDKKNKRKKSNSPGGSEYFLKKVNRNQSPQN